MVDAILETGWIMNTNAPLMKGNSIETVIHHDFFVERTTKTSCVTQSLFKLEFSNL
jgi:hypothetical protein